MNLGDARIDMAGWCVKFENKISARLQEEREFQVIFNSQISNTTLFILVSAKIRTRRTDEKRDSSTRLKNTNTPRWIPRENR